MQNFSKVMLAVAGTLMLAPMAGAQALDPSRTEEEVRQRTEEQLKNAGEADQVRTQQQVEQAVRQGTAEKAGMAAQGQQVQERKRIYGEGLMTEQERKQYQERLQGMNTDQERKQFQKEHKKQMQARAKQQGKALDQDGNVLSGDQLRDRDRDQDRDRDRDRIHQVDPMPRSNPAPAPAPGRGGGGRGSG
jgi:hypothetical protein